LKPTVKDNQWYAYNYQYFKHGLLFDDSKMIIQSLTEVFCS